MNECEFSDSALFKKLCHAVMRFFRKMHCFLMEF